MLTYKEGRIVDDNRSLVDIFKENRENFLKENAKDLYPPLVEMWLKRADYCIKKIEGLGVHQIIPLARIDMNTKYMIKYNDGRESIMVWTKNEIDELAKKAHGNPNDDVFEDKIFEFLENDQKCEG